jgi:hypothetical protein
VSITIFRKRAQQVQAALQRMHKMGARARRSDPASATDTAIAFFFFLF